MSVKLKHFAGLLGFPFLVASLAMAAEPLPVRVSDAWIREAPPVSRTLAGYVTLRNDGEKPVAIVGGSSAAFARIEMHRTRITDGVARMARQDRVEIPAGGSVLFEPGGYHLMLMDPTRALKNGDSVEIALELEGGSTVAVSAIVRSDRLQ